MKTAWVKGLEGQEKEEMTLSFNASAALRQRVIQLMQEKINASRKAIISKDAYSNPNWAYLQADAVGYERALQEIISLME